MTGCVRTEKRDTALLSIVRQNLKIDKLQALDKLQERVKICFKNILMISFNIGLSSKSTR